ncbi:MAG: ice-binding family protein [Candidatus Komeilibacteria bacterium]|nr:ice-binding family protein [Candidatus Komeilibacteria bacterium]
MKTFNKFLIVVLVVAFMLSLTGLTRAATTINLGVADNFAVLAGSGITNTGATTITGDVGSYPTLTQTGFGSVTLTGTNHAGDGVTQQGKTDLTAAYIDAAGRGGASAIVADLGGQTLTPGVYNTASGIGITGELTLNGGDDPNAVFIFQAGSTLTTAAASHVTLTHSAQACNVFWQVGSSATLGTTSDFKGNILALASITDNGGSTIAGRMLARNAAVTLNNTTVTKATCSGVLPATISVVKTIINDNGGSKVVADFPLFVNGVPISSGVTTVFPAAAYTITETTSPIYAQSFSGDCNASGVVNLAAGEHKLCVITNNDIASLPTSSGGGGWTAYDVIPAVPPLIDVVKVPSPLALPNGPGLVEYTYTLTNIGTVPVTNVTMVDDTCNPIILASGDINNDAKLDLTETWVYQCSTTLAATHTNTVVATGWANGISAVDVASATVVVSQPIIPPLIHVTKLPNPLTLPAGGGVAVYTYTVTNPGTEPLSNVSIIDDKCTSLPGRVTGHPGDLNHNDLLESNESWSFTCRTYLTTTTTNTATASGEANGLTAKDFAIANVIVYAAVPVATPVVPKLPKAGFDPNEKNIPWNIVVMAGLLGLISTSLVVVLKKHKI